MFYAAPFGNKVLILPRVDDIARGTRLAEEPNELSFWWERFNKIEKMRKVQTDWGQLPCAFRDVTRSTTQEPKIPKNLTIKHY